MKSWYQWMNSISSRFLNKVISISSDCKMSRSVMSDSLQAHGLQPMGLSQQESWSRLAFPPPGNLPNPGIKPTSPVAPALAGDSLPLGHLGSPPIFAEPKSNDTNIIKWIIQYNKYCLYSLSMYLLFKNEMIILAIWLLTNPNYNFFPQYRQWFPINSKGHFSVFIDFGVSAVGHFPSDVLMWFLS